MQSGGVGLWRSASDRSRAPTLDDWAQSQRFTASWTKQGSSDVVRYEKIAGPQVVKLVGGEYSDNEFTSATAVPDCIAISGDNGLWHNYRINMDGHHTHSASGARPEQDALRMTPVRKGRSIVGLEPC